MSGFQVFGHRLQLLRGVSGHLNAFFVLHANKGAGYVMGGVCTLFKGTGTRVKVVVYRGHVVTNVMDNRYVFTTFRGVGGLIRGVGKVYFVLLLNGGLYNFVPVTFVLQIGVLTRRYLNGYGDVTQIIGRRRFTFVLLVPGRTPAIKHFKGGVFVVGGRHNTSVVTGQVFLFQIRVRVLVFFIGRDPIKGVIPVGFLGRSLVNGPFGRVVTQGSGVV